MKIQTKIFLGFLAILLINSFFIVFIIWESDRITLPLTQTIPKQIKSLSDSSYLDGLAQIIKYHDEVLTQSARNYAFTENIKWKTRYNAVEPELDKAIKDAIQNGDAKDREFFKSVDSANLALVKMEENAIGLVDSGKSKDAVKILESSEYWKQKDIYEKGLRDYVDRRGKEYNEVLIASTKALEGTVTDIGVITGSIRNVVLLLAPFVLLLSLIFSLLIARSIYKPIKKLKDIAKKVSKGDLSQRVNLKTKCCETVLLKT